MYYVLGHTIIIFCKEAHGLYIYTICMYIVCVVSTRISFTAHTHTHTDDDDVETWECKRLDNSAVSWWNRDGAHGLLYIAR